jgi:hypothetical protein
LRITWRHVDIRYAYFAGSRSIVRNPSTQKNVNTHPSPTDRKKDRKY